MRFSVIIPAFNAAATLAGCLESIRSQPFQDCQVLIVDDGSCDETGKIATEYAGRDPRFRLITTSHAGTGAARNRGLEQAQGEYVLYLDADDCWRCPDLLERLELQLRQGEPDVLMFQMVKTTGDGRVLERYAKPRFLQENALLALQDVYADLVRDGQSLASACNKCVRRSLLTEKGIAFREDVIGEDIDWVLQLFSHAKTICLMNLDAYAYTQHKGESRSSRAEAPDDLVGIVCDWADRLEREALAHAEAVAGLVAFEYAICMGSHHRLSRENKRRMRSRVRLLHRGLDRKTKMIRNFCRVFGYGPTCLAIRVYLRLRRIW